MSESNGSGRVGVIGLGMIGGGVAVSLARSGRIPAVFDVRPGVSDALVGLPEQLGSPAAVAAVSDVVLVAVVDAQQVREVLVGEGGLLTVGRGGLVVVLLSTVSLTSVKELAGMCASHGVTFLDAGVTGGARAADNGLVVMIGGPDDTVARAMPILDDFAKSVVHCGPLGAGMAAKLARNALTYSSWAAVREASTLASASGVPLDRFLEVLEEGTDGGTDPLGMLRMTLAGMRLPEEQVASIEGLAHKDLAAAQELAGEVRVDLPIADVVRPQMGKVYRGVFTEPLPEPSDERGLAMMARVYGEAFASRMPSGAVVPAITDTVEHLFANIWTRPYLTLRDRRLLALAATAMLGRKDLLEVQLRGALENGDLTTDQLREICLFLPYYTGWGNGAAVSEVAEKLIAEGLAH